MIFMIPCGIIFKKYYTGGMNLEYWNFNDVSSVPDAFVTLINNYAAASMELGAIVEYNINIYIVDEY